MYLLFVGYISYKYNSLSYFDKINKIPTGSLEKKHLAPRSKSRDSILFADWSNYFFQIIVMSVLSLGDMTK